MAVKAIPFEKFGQEICQRRDCDKCPYGERDFDDFFCPIICNGSLSGFVLADDLTEDDQRLLGVLKRKDKKGMKTIAITNQKGGTGKTTTALALAEGLEYSGMGKRVLLIDLDAQGNLTASTDTKAGYQGAAVSAAEVLAGEVPIEKALQTPQGRGGDLWLLPSSLRLSAADMTLTATGKEFRLKEAIQSIAERFDYCVIDCPPTLGILTVNALTAADGIVVPAQADAFSLQGISQLWDTVGTIRRYCNPSLSVYGILLTRHNGRVIISKECEELLVEEAQNFGTRLFDTRIRECTALKEAQARHTPIYTYAPKSNAAEDYRSFITELKKAM